MKHCRDQWQTTLMTSDVSPVRHKTAIRCLSCHLHVDDLINRALTHRYTLELLLMVCVWWFSGLRTSGFCLCSLRQWRGTRRFGCEWKPFVYLNEKHLRFVRCVCVCVCARAEVSLITRDQTKVPLPRSCCFTVFVYKTLVYLWF